MTFKLKTLEKLKEHFDNTKTQILLYKTVTTIEELKVPRVRSALKLLEAVLQNIEEQINILAQERDARISKIDQIEIDNTKQKDGEKPKYSPSKLKEEAEKKRQLAESLFKERVEGQILAYYGAMLIAQHDISRCPEKHAGMLSSALAEAIGTHPHSPIENKPTANDDEAFYVAFNVTMHTQLFPITGTRKCLKEEHMLSALPKEDLERILTTAYEFEKNARMAVVGSLVAEGKSVIKLSDYVINEKMETPASAIERFKSFTELRTNFASLTMEELNAKGKGTISEIGERAIQINFLKKLVELLENLTIKDTEKTAILAGAMHLVRREIQKSYEESILHYMRTPDNSKVHELLGGLLGAANVSPLDQEALLQAANNFIRYATLESKKTEQKTSTLKVINQAHPFTEIVGFNLPAILNLFFEMIGSCRDNACKQMFIAMKEREKVEQPTSSGTGYLASFASYAKMGLFGFGGGPKADVPDTASTDSLPLDAPSASLRQ